MKQVSDLKYSVSGLLSGIDLQNVDNLYGAFQRAARVITQKAPIPETQQTQNITLYSGVTDYSINSSIFGTSIYDIRPQGVSRTAWDFVFKKFGDDFDRAKQYIYNGTMCAFAYSNGTPIIRIVSSQTPKEVILDSMTDITDWVASGSVSNLAQDTSVFYQIPGSLRFTLTGNSVGILTKTIQSPIDLSTYQNVGVGFLAIQIPAGTTSTDLTNIILKVGSDSSNYSQITQTTGFLGAWTVGNWLLVSFDFSSVTTVGTPNWSAIQYLQVSLTHANTFTNFRLGDLFMSLPSQNQIIYGSAGFFKVGDTVSTNITNDNDYIILNDAAYTIYEYECAKSVLQQTGGGSADATIAHFDGILNSSYTRTGRILTPGLYDIYRAENPSAILRTSGSYYEGSSYGNGWYNGNY